jgi:methyl-accepting chemotaxis protein
MSLKARLLLIILSMVVISILLIGVMSLNIAVNESTKALTESVKQRLISQNVQTEEAVVEYFDFIESQVRTKSFNPSVVDAAKVFLPAFNEYLSVRDLLSCAEKTELNLITLLTLLANTMTSIQMISVALPMH